MTVKIKRVYEKPEPGDGFRILIDRLWPRGLKKEEAEIDLWLKDVAPSGDLRVWFGHDPGKWGEFKKKYFKELAAAGAAVTEIRRRARQGTVTLVFGAKDEKHCNATALLEYLKK
jgi:uncharacterized protein YeaO (DUF488 family)